MFWTTKKCKHCERKIRSDWGFCAYCGKSLKEKDVFEEVEKDFEKIDRLFHAKQPKFIFKHPIKTKGVSITITSSNLSHPKVEVRQFGDYKKPERRYEEPKYVRVPKFVEEPETKIQRAENKQIITLNLPDVKGLDDIEIKRLENSIEIRAFAGDKGYFKLIPIPSHASVSEEFKDGTLKIEVVK